MGKFYQCLLSEFKKRKRSNFLLLHLFLPFILITILVLYTFLRNGPLSATASYVILFEIIGVSSPVIISILCGMVAEAESEAGQFQNILGVAKSKSIAFLSQITMLLLAYSTAIFLTTSLYVWALKFIVHIEEVHLTLYYSTSIIFIISAIFQYFFYHIISYKHGIEISGIFGFMGMIIAALSLTSLADNIWPFLPWAWANRFSEYVTHFFSVTNFEVMNDSTQVTGLFSFCSLTICIIFINIVWIQKWEGRRQ